MTTNAVAGPMHEVTESAPPAKTATSNLLQRAMEVRIGIIPLPVYLLLLGLIAAFSYKGKISGEVTVMIA